MNVGLIDDGSSVEGSYQSLLLAILMTIILAGALPLLSSGFRGLTWMVWLLTYFLLYLAARKQPLGQLLKPALPYLVWLLFYLAWGLIVSPLHDVLFAAKTLVLTVTLTACMAVLTARPGALRIFASVVQFAVAGNLLVLILCVRWPGFAAVVDAATGSTDPFRLGITRFAGLWGNPNMAGYICLLATLLSVLAVPWIGWLGRLSCLPILFLSASRKAFLLYGFLLLLHLLLVSGRSLRTWLVAGFVGAGLALAITLSGGALRSSQPMADNVLLARILDVSETTTSDMGGETRYTLLKQWTRTLAVAPWHGYGLGTMAGTLYDNKDPFKVVSKGLYPVGAHNTYLGLWIEVGPFGALAFLVVMLHYARKSWFLHGQPSARWVCAGLVMCNLIVLLVSHSHLFCLEGQMAFGLMFVLPSCAGLPALTGKPRPERG